MPRGFVVRRVESGRSVQRRVVQRGFEQPLHRLQCGHFVLGRRRERVHFVSERIVYVRRVDRLSHDMHVVCNRLSVRRWEQARALWYRFGVLAPRRGGVHNMCGGYEDNGRGADDENPVYILRGWLQV